MVDAIYSTLVDADMNERSVRVRTRSGDTHAGFVDDVTSDGTVTLTADGDNQVTIALDAIESVQQA